MDPEMQKKVSRLVRKGGLAVSRKIIQAHDGRMWMNSESGQGSTVLFTLPSV
jgi:signal transduction histidine kinase